MNLSAESTSTGSTLRTLLSQPAELTTEAEVGNLFNGCDPGAVPPIGAAYGIKAIWGPNTGLAKRGQFSQHI